MWFVEAAGDGVAGEDCEAARSDSVGREDDKCGCVCVESEDGGSDSDEPRRAFSRLPLVEILYDPELEPEEPDTPAT